MEFNKYRLKDIAEYKNERIETNQLTTVNYISTENLLPNKQGKQPANNLPSSKTVKKYTSSDILISNIRPYFKKIWQANSLGGHSNDVLNITSINEKISNDYLYYYLSQDKFFQYMTQTSKGTKMPRGDKEAIMEYEIKVPKNIVHQNFISSLGKSLDNKIEINKKIIANLEELSQTLFKHWFVDFEFPDEDGNPYKSSGGEMVESELGDIPEGWEIQKINQIVNFINGHAFKSKELYKYNKNKKMYHVFKMGHIKQGGGLKRNATKSFYDKKKKKKLEKFVLKKGDILMSMTDMKNKVAILGNTALMNRDDKYIVNQRVGLLRLKEDTYIDYPFLYILTNSNEFLTTLRKKANSGVQVNLTSKAIKEQLVIVPSKNYHNKFNTITKPIYLKIFDLEIENEYLTILRDTLLPKLMSGELEIPDDIEVNTDELSI